MGSGVDCGVDKSITGGERAFQTPIQAQRASYLCPASEPQAAAMERTDDTELEHSRLTEGSQPSQKKFQGIDVLSPLDYALIEKISVTGCNQITLKNSSKRLLLE